MHIRKKILKIWFLMTFIFLSLYIHAQEKPYWLQKYTFVDVSKIEKSHYTIFTQWLDEQGKTPIEYAVEQCLKHQIVIFGEVHGIKDYVDLFNQLIPEVYHKAGVRYVVLEVCHIGQNEKIARLIEAEKYDSDLALEIARSALRGIWGHKEYWDIFKTVWKLNKSLSENGEPMKVIGMRPNTDLVLQWLWQNNKLSDEKLIKKAEEQAISVKNDDVFMADIIKQKIIETGEKGIVWVGGFHSFTHYMMPWVNEDMELTYELSRMGYLLNKEYKEKIFQILCHYTFDSPERTYQKYNKKYTGGETQIDNLIETIMEERGNQAVGFDVFVSPFANLRDKNAYLFHWQQQVRFSDICRGYIYIKPCNKLSQCTWIEDFVSKEVFRKYKIYYETVYDRKFEDVDEFNNFLNVKHKYNNRSE